MSIARNGNLLLVVLGCCLLAGCTLIQQMMPGHRAAVQRAEDLRDLNLRVMRFADEYAGRLKETLAGFQETARSPQERLSAQNWKTQQVESAYTIASGPNPVTNALDMVVLATLSRLVLDDLWVQQLYGERARPVQEMHRTLEDGAWGLVTDILTQSQVAQLREVITEWRRRNPDVRAVAYIHFSEFAKSLASPRPGESASPGNLFSLLGLDPFTQLDPAVRELSQTRELAERAIFYMQRTPALLDMQVQRVAYQFAVTPEARSLLADLGRASLVGTAADQLVQSLPELLAREREALLSHLMRELEDRQGAVASLSGELRATLQAGTQTADALQSTLETFDRVASRFPPRDRAADSPAAERFDITQYTAMLHELTTSIRELDALSRSAASAAPALRDAMQAAADRFERILNRVFLQVLVLIVVAISTAWAGAIAYRAAVFRMQQSARSPRH